MNSKLNKVYIISRIHTFLEYHQLTKTGINQTICLQYTVTLPCTDPLGIEEGNITDNQLSASSTSESYIAANARLNLPNGGWVAAANDQAQWLAIDLYRQRQVTGLVLQGKEDLDQWVTTYHVDYSTDGVTWSYVRDENNTVEVCIRDTCLYFVCLFHSVVND